jgi:hypothetical protein
MELAGTAASRAKSRVKRRGRWETIEFQNLRNPGAEMGKKVRDGEEAIAKSPRRPLLRFEFASIRADSWLGWHSIFNHI